VTSGKPVQRTKCICDGVRVGAKIARALFSFFFLSLKEKRTLKHNGASRVFGTDGLQDNTPNAEEMDGTRCTKRLIIPIIISETCKGT